MLIQLGSWYIEQKHYSQYLHKINSDKHMCIFRVKSKLAVNKPPGNVVRLVVQGSDNIKHFYDVADSLELDDMRFKRLWPILN